MEDSVYFTYTFYMNIYALNNTADIISPALIYYKDIIAANTKRTIEMAGGPERLWPHVKSHKTKEMIRMQIDMGISRFKCATIAEAEMTAEAGASQIILAYPLLGPNISRFIRLVTVFNQVRFYAIGDDIEQLRLLSEEAVKAKIQVNVLADVDAGMHRTGVPFDRLESFYEKVTAITGISLNGLHCYDGHLHDSDYNLRKAKVDEIDRQVLDIQASLVRKGMDCGLLVMGGTPAFPCRTASLAERSGMYLSPGTCFIGDWGTGEKIPDMAFPPGAALFTRVVSHPGGNSFTLDLGSKGIAADPPGARGIIAGMEEAKPLFQSEEHWVFAMPEGKNPPPIGSACYVLPAHICPTSALYQCILAVRDGTIAEEWQVAARNRKLRF